MKPTKCMMLPILSPGQDVPTGLLVCGANQMRALDDSYTTFLNLVTNQVATALANARAHEEERRKAEVLGNFT
jgi:GAF domain-containing protein